MKCLIVEDDFASRQLIKKYLSCYFRCDIVVNGQEAITAFTNSLDEQDPYDLICLDIMMPVTDGHETLKAVREIEYGRGIQGLNGVKVIMMTALDDSKNVMSAFREGCEVYLVKPIERSKLLCEMIRLGLIEKTHPVR